MTISWDDVTGLGSAEWLAIAAWWPPTRTSGTYFHYASKKTRGAEEHHVNNH